MVMSYILYVLGFSYSLLHHPDCCLRALDWCTDFKSCSRVKTLSTILNQRNSSMMSRLQTEVGVVLSLCVWWFRLSTEVKGVFFRPVTLHRQTAGHWRLSPLSVVLPSGTTEGFLMESLFQQYIIINSCTAVTEGLLQKWWFSYRASGGPGSELKSEGGSSDFIKRRLDLGNSAPSSFSFSESLICMTDNRRRGQKAGRMKRFTHMNMITRSASKQVWCHFLLNVSWRHKISFSSSLIIWILAPSKLKCLFIATSRSNQLLNNFQLTGDNGRPVNR